jgi:hypothetical protein
MAKAAYAIAAQARVSTSYHMAYLDIFGASDDNGTSNGMMAAHEEI